MQQRTETDFARGARLQREALSIYDDPNERYVVSLIVSYSEEDLDGGEQIGVLDKAVAEMDDKMMAAAKAALDLTRDGGSDGTHWYVFDRKTNEGRFIEQGEFDEGWTAE